MFFLCVDPLQTNTFTVALSEFELNFGKFCTKIKTYISLEKVNEDRYSTRGF